MRIIIAGLIVGAFANRAANQQTIETDATKCDEDKVTPDSLADLARTEVEGDGPGILGKLSGDPAFAEFMEQFKGERHLDLEVIKEATQDQRMAMARGGSIDEKDVLALGAIKGLAEEDTCALIAEVKMSAPLLMMLINGRAIETAECLTVPYVMNKMKDSAVNEKANQFALEFEKRSEKAEVMRTVMSKWSQNQILLDTTKLQLVMNPTSYFHCAMPRPAAPVTTAKGKKAKSAAPASPEAYDTTAQCAELLKSVTETDDQIKAGLSRNVHFSVLNQLTGNSKTILELFGFTQDLNTAYMPPSVASTNLVVAEAVQNPNYDLPRDGIKALILKGHLDSELCRYLQGPEPSQPTKFQLSEEEFLAIVGQLPAEPAIKQRKDVGLCIVELVKTSSAFVKAALLPGWCAAGVIGKEKLLVLANHESCALGAEKLAEADALEGTCKFGKADAPQVMSAFGLCKDVATSEYEGKDILDLHFGKIGRALSKESDRVFTHAQLSEMASKFETGDLMELALKEPETLQTQAAMFEGFLSDQHNSRFLHKLGYISFNVAMRDTTGMTPKQIKDWEHLDGDKVNENFRMHCSAPWRCTPDMVDSSQAVPSKCTKASIKTALSAAGPTAEVPLISDETTGLTMYGLRLYASGGLCPAGQDPFEGENCMLGTRRRGECAWLWSGRRAMIKPFMRAITKSTRCYCEGSHGPPAGSCLDEAAKAQEQCDHKKSGDYDKLTVDGWFPKYDGGLLDLYKTAAEDGTLIKAVQDHKLNFFRCSA